MLPYGKQTPMRPSHSIPWRQPGEGSWLSSRTPWPVRLRRGVRAVAVRGERRLQHRTVGRRPARLERLCPHVRQQLSQQHQAAGAKGDRPVDHVVRSGQRTVLARGRERARHWHAPVPHTGRRHPDAPSPHRSRRARDQHLGAGAGSGRPGERRLRGAARRAVSRVRSARLPRAGLRAFPAGARMGAVLP